MQKIFYLFVLLTTISVYAFDPTYDVTRGALQTNSTLCGYGYNPSCTQNVSEQANQNITITLSKYGAVAESLKTGAVSSSSNADSKLEAEKIALDRCESIKGNGKCKVFGLVNNGCISLAEGKKGTVYKIFFGSKDKGQSETVALNKCRKSGAKGCRILMPEECSLPVISH